MRDHSGHVELSREAAVAGMVEALGEAFAKPHVEQVSVSECCGRVLAEDVLAKTDIPNVLTCCMDSIALRWDDICDFAEDELPDVSTWERGREWEFANTGISMPAGFDTAVVVEHVEIGEGDKLLAIDSLPSARYAGCRAAGSSMKRGDVAVECGCIINADIASRIAAAGRDCVLVSTKPRVAFIPTGNELVAPNVPYSEGSVHRFAGEGKVYESNSAIVRGKVEKWGGEFVPFDIVADDREAIREAVERACSVADIVILNAGSSKGSDDWSVEVLEEMGQMICHQTNHGPGHHSSYAVVNGKPIVGISGPAGGASFTLNFYLLPLMRRYFGLNPDPVRIPARLTQPFPAGGMHGLAKENPAKLPGEQRPPEAVSLADSFFSVKFVTLEAREDGALAATPVAGKAGSPATQHANAYCLVPAAVGDAAPEVGDVIWVELREQSL